MENEVNNAREKLFTKTVQPPLPQSLPPTKDALYLHWKSCYQYLQWKKLLDYNFWLPNPMNHGWLKEENGSFAVRWITTRPSPKSMLEFISYSGRKSKCQTNQCNCFAFNLPCTDWCL